MSLYSTTLQQLDISESTFQQKERGRVYKRLSISRQLFKAHDDGYHPRVARQLVTALKRYINTRPKHERRTPAFVDEIRRKILCLHEYNVQIAKVKFKYPRSEQLDLLLIQYVELECGLLYNTYKEVDKEHEDNVTQRVLRLLRLILHDALQNGDVSLKATSEACDKILLKLFAKVRIDCSSENKLVTNTVTKLLSSLNLLEEVNKLKGKNIPFYQDTLLKDPLVCTIRQTLETSDYYSDDDSDDEIEIVPVFDDLFGSASKHSPFSTILEDRTIFNQSSKNFEFSLRETPNYFLKSSTLTNFHETRRKFDTIGQNKENSNLSIYNSTNLKSCVNEKFSNLKKIQDDVFNDGSRSNNEDGNFCTNATFFNKGIDVRQETEKISFFSSNSVSKILPKIEDRDGHAKKSNYTNVSTHKENWKQERSSFQRSFLLQEVTDVTDPFRERDAASKILRDLTSLNDDNQQKVGNVSDINGSSQDTVMHKNSSVGHLKNLDPINLPQALPSQNKEKSHDAFSSNDGAINIDALPDSTNNFCKKTTNESLNDNVVTIEIDDDDDDDQNFGTTYNGLLTVNSNLLHLNEIKREENEENQSPNYSTSNSDNKQNFSGSDKSSKNSDSTTFEKMDNPNGDFTQDADISAIIISDSEDEVSDVLESEACGIGNYSKDTKFEANQSEADRTEDKIQHFQSEQIPEDPDIVNVEKRTDLKLALETVQNVKFSVINLNDTNIHRHTNFSEEGKYLDHVDVQKQNDEVMEQNTYNTEDVCQRKQINSAASKNCFNSQKEFVIADAENDDNNYQRFDGVTIEHNKNVISSDADSACSEDFDNTFTTECNDTHEDTFGAEYTENQQIELNSQLNTCEHETDNSATESVDCVTNDEMYGPKDSIVLQENNTTPYCFIEGSIETSECRDNLNTEEGKTDIQGAEREENQNILPVTNGETEEENHFSTVNESVSTEIYSQVKIDDVNVSVDQELQGSTSLEEPTTHVEENLNKMQMENDVNDKEQFVDSTISEQHITDTHISETELQNFEEMYLKHDNTTKNDEESVNLHGFNEVIEEDNEVVVTTTADSPVHSDDVDVIPTLSAENRDDESVAIEKDGCTVVEMTVDSVIEPVDFTTNSRSEFHNIVEEEKCFEEVVSDVNNIQFEVVSEVDDQPSHQMTDEATSIESPEDSFSCENDKNDSNVQVEEQVVSDFVNDIQSEVCNEASDYLTITHDELSESKSLDLSFTSGSSETIQSTQEPYSPLTVQVVSEPVNNEQSEAHEHPSEEPTKIGTFELACIDNSVEHSPHILPAEVQIGDIGAVTSDSASHVEVDVIHGKDDFDTAIRTENYEQNSTVEATVPSEESLNDSEQVSVISDSKDNLQNEIICKTHHDLLHQPENPDFEGLPAAVSVGEHIESLDTSNTLSDVLNYLRVVPSESGKIHTEEVSKSEEIDHSGSNKIQPVVSTNQLSNLEASQVEEIGHFGTNKIQPVVLTDQLTNLEQVEVISDSVRADESEKQKQSTNIGGELEFEGENFDQFSVKESVENAPFVATFERQVDNLEAQVISDSASDAPSGNISNYQAEEAENFDTVSESHEQLSSGHTDEVTAAAANFDSSFEGEKLQNIPPVDVVEVNITNLEVVPDSTSNVCSENEPMRNIQNDKVAKEDHHDKLSTINNELTITTEDRLNTVPHAEVISAGESNIQSELVRTNEESSAQLNASQLTETAEAEKPDGSSVDKNDDTLIPIEDDEVTEKKSSTFSSSENVSEKNGSIEKNESYTRINEVLQPSVNSVVCQISLENTHLALEKIAEDVIWRRVQAVRVESSQVSNDVSKKDSNASDGAEYGPKLDHFDEVCHDKTVQPPVINADVSSKEKEVVNLPSPAMIEQAKPENTNIPSPVLYTLPSTISQVQYNEYNSEKKVGGDLELLANIAADQATLAVKPESEKETLRRGRSKMRLELSQQSKISRSEDPKYKPHDFISIENSTLPAITNNVYAQKRFMETNTTSEDSNDSCESTLFIDLGENLKNSEKPSKSIYEEDTICDLLELITTEDKEGVCLSIPDTEEHCMSDSFYILKQQLEMSVDNFAESNTIQNPEETDVTDKQSKIKTTKTTDHSIDNILNKSPTVETKVLVQDLSDELNKDSVTELADANEKVCVNPEVESPTPIQLDEIPKIDEHKDQVGTIQDQNINTSDVIACEIEEVPSTINTGADIVISLPEAVQEQVQDLSMMPEDLTIDKSNTTIEKLDEHNETTFKTKAAVKSYEDKLHPNPYVLLHQYDSASMLSTNGSGMQTRSRSKRSEVTSKELVPFDRNIPESIECNSLPTLTNASQESCTSKVEDIVAVDSESLEKNNENSYEETFETTEIASVNQITEHKVEENVEIADITKTSFIVVDDDNIKSTNEPIKVHSVEESLEKNNIECAESSTEKEVVSSCEQMDTTSNQQDAIVENETRELITSGVDVQSPLDEKNLSQKSLDLVDVPIKGFNAKKHSDKINLDKTTKLSKTPDEAKGRSLENTIKKMKERVREKLSSVLISKEMSEQKTSQVSGPEVSKDENDTKKEPQSQPIVEEPKQKSVEHKKERRRSRSSSKSRLSDKKSQETLEKEKPSEDIEKEKSNNKSSLIRKSQEDAEKKSVHKSSPNRKSQERVEREKSVSKSSSRGRSQEHVGNEKSSNKSSPSRRSQERAEKEKSVSKSIKSQEDTEKEKSIKKRSPSRSSSKSHSTDKHSKHGESQNDHKRRSKSRSLDKEKTTHSHDETVADDSKKHNKSSTTKNSDGKLKNTSSEKTSSKRKHSESKDKLINDDKEDNHKKGRSKSPAKSKTHDSKEKERNHGEKKRSGDKTKVEESKIKAETKGKLKKDGGSDSQTDKEKLALIVSHKNDKKVEENVLKSENKSSRSKSKKHVTSEESKTTEEGQVNTHAKQESHKSTKSRSLTKNHSSKLDDKDKHRESHKAKSKEKENHFKSVQDNNKNDPQNKTDHSKNDKSRRSCSKEKTKPDSYSRSEKRDKSSKDNNKDGIKQIHERVGESKESNSLEETHEEKEKNKKQKESIEKLIQVKRDKSSKDNNKDGIKQIHESVGESKETNSVEETHEEKEKNKKQKESIEKLIQVKRDKSSKDINKDGIKQIHESVGESKESNSVEETHEEEEKNQKQKESIEKLIQVESKVTSDIEKKDTDIKVIVETEPKSSSPSEQLPDVCIEASEVKNKEVRKIDIPKKRKYDMWEENSIDPLKAKIQKKDIESEPTDGEKSLVEQDIPESNKSEDTIPPPVPEASENVSCNVSVTPPLLEEKTKVIETEADINPEKSTAVDLTYESFSSGIKVSSCMSDEAPNPVRIEKVQTPASTNENTISIETQPQSIEIKNSSEIRPSSDVEVLGLQTDVKSTVLLSESIPISSEPVYIDAVFSSSSTDINVQVLSSSVDSTVKHLVGHEPDLSLIPTVSSAATDQFSFAKDTGASNGENLNTSDIFHTSLSLGDISPTKLPLAANQSLDFNLPPTSISEINNSMNLVQTLGPSTINFEVSTTSEIEIQQTSKPNSFGDNIVRTEIRCFMEKEAPADHNYTLSDPLVGGNNEDKNILTTGLSLTNSPGEFQLNESHLEDLSFNENNFIEENGTLEDLALLLPCKKEKPDFDNIIDEAIPKPEDIQNSIKRLNMLVDISQSGQPKTVPIDNAIDQSSNSDRNVGLGIDYAVSELLFLGGGEVTTQNNSFSGIPDIDNINIIETNDSSVHPPKQTLEEPVIETPPPSNECSTLTDCNSFTDSVLADTNKKVVVEPVEQCPITSFEQLKKDYITDSSKSVEKNKTSKPKSHHSFRTTNFATFLESVKRDANKNENKAKDEIENYMVRRHNRTPVVPSKKKNVSQQQTPSPPQAKKCDNSFDTNKTLNVPESGKECRIRVKTDLVNVHEAKSLPNSDSLEYINEHDQNIASEVVLPFSKPSPSELKLDAQEKKETSSKPEIKHSRFDKMGNDYIMENILNVYSDPKLHKSPVGEKTVKKIEVDVGKKRKSTDNEVRQDEKRQKKSDDELEMNHSSSEPCKSDAKVPINKPSNDEIFDKLVEEGPVNKIFAQKMSEHTVLKKESNIKKESKNIGYFTHSPNSIKKESGTNAEPQRSRGYFTNDPPNTTRKETGQLKVDANVLKSRGGYLTVPDPHRKEKNRSQPTASQPHDARYKESQRYPYPNRREQKKFGYFTSDHVSQLDRRHAEKGHIPVPVVETSSKRPIRNSASSYNSKSDPCTTREYKTRDRRMSSEHPNSIYPNASKPETSNQQDEDKFSWIDRFSGTGLFDTPSGLFTSPGGKR